MTVMLTWLRTRYKPTAVLGLAAIPMFWWAWESQPATRGQNMARTELMQGQYVVLTYGLAAGWYGEWADRLKQRYGIETRPIAGCVVSDSLLKYVEGHNTVVMRAARRKFGRDVFEECAGEAQAAWKQRRAALAVHP